MYNHSRLAATLGCVATLAMVGCATNGTVAPISGATQQQAHTAPLTGPGWIYQDGVLFHTPHYMHTVQWAAAHRVKPPILLTYGNGPVLTAPKVYLILWGFGTYGDPDKVGALLKQYGRAMGGSSHNNIYTQYYKIVAGKTIKIRNPARQFGGVWADNTDSVPSNPSDAQVAAEALLGVTHFGYNANGSYVVATPTGHSTPGFGSSFCAYHSATSDNGQLVSYTNLPYMPDAGQSCGANFPGVTPPADESGVDEGVTIVEGHEYGESITDPQPFTGWNSSQGEIGDLCAWTNIANDPFGTKSYTSQPMFSNKTQSCVQSF
jgi:serine protease